MLASRRSTLFAGLPLQKRISDSDGSDGMVVSMVSKVSEGDAQCDCLNCNFKERFFAAYC